MTNLAGGGGHYGLHVVLPVGYSGGLCRMATAVKSARPGATWITLVVTLVGTLVVKKPGCLLHSLYMAPCMPVL